MIGAGSIPVGGVLSVKHNLAVRPPCKRKAVGSIPTTGSLPLSATVRNGLENRRPDETGYQVQLLTGALRVDSPEAEDATLRGLSRRGKLAGSNPAPLIKEDIYVVINNESHKTRV